MSNLKIFGAILILFELSFPDYVQANSEVESKLVSALRGSSNLSMTSSSPANDGIYDHPPQADEMQAPPQPNGSNCKLIGSVVERNASGIILPNKNCCNGLVLAGNDVCVEYLTPEDPSLINCQNASSCAPGEGCFPRRYQDLFQNDPTKSAEVAANVMDYLYGENGEGRILKPAGESCLLPSECASYSCIAVVPRPSSGAAFKCEEKRICRKAEIDEVAIGNQCSEGLEVINGKCRPQEGLFLGGLDTITSTQVGQCQVEVPQVERDTVLVALLNLRAMEYTFSTMKSPTTDSSRHDCLQITKLLNDIGKSITETRRSLLKDYNKTLTSIEIDNDTLLNAKEGNSSTVTLYDGSESLSQNDLSTRQTSGYDAMMSQLRRNSLHFAYESGMKNIYTDVVSQLAKLNREIPYWEGGDDSWSLNGDTVIYGGQYRCDAKYKKRKFLFRWKRRYYNNIGSRWATFYRLDQGINVAENEIIANYLSYVSGRGPSELSLPKEAQTGRLYLMDPLMPGKLEFQDYGDYLNRSEWSWGRRDLRVPRRLKDNQYEKLYSDIQNKVKDYYRGLKEDVTQTNFVYEPELLTLDMSECDWTTGTLRCAKDCVENPSNPGCGAYDQRLYSTVGDVSFAQFLAYSMNGVRNYDNYFTNENTWRRMFLNKLERDLVTVVQYYSYMTEQRQKQDECLNRLISATESNLSNDANSTGLIEGSSVNFNRISSNVSGQAIRNLESSTRDEIELPEPLAQRRLRFSIPARPNSIPLVTGTGMIGSSGSGTPLSGSGSISSQGTSGSGQSAIRERIKEMNEVNSKAKSRGVNVAGKEQQVSKMLASVGSPLSPRSTGLSSGMRDRFKGASRKGTLAASVGQTSEDLSEDAKNNNQASYSSGQSFAAGYGSKVSDNRQRSENPSGISNADKENIFVNYERTSNRYKRNDEDDLFDVISKAYVRNLGRILPKRQSLKNE